MDNEKAWYLSKGVWGGIVAGLMPLVAVGFGLDAETQAALLQSSEALIAGGVGIAGAVLAILGRVKATKKVK